MNADVGGSKLREATCIFILTSTSTFHSKWLKTIPMTCANNTQNDKSQSR